jgi:hypothetical protein
LAVVKPASSTPRSYVPGGTSDSEKKPSAFDTAVRVYPVSGLVMVTVAPGSTPPWVSVTTPVISAVVACDCA